MVRDHDSGGSNINSTARIISCKNTFDDNRPGPQGANPLHIFPSDSRLRQSRIHVQQLHGTFARNDYVRYAIQKNSARSFAVFCGPSSDANASIAPTSMWG